MQKVMTQPINQIFELLQEEKRVQVLLFDSKNMRIEGQILGFDEYMNLVLVDAEEYYPKKDKRVKLGRILLKGETICLIRDLSETKDTQEESSSDQQ